jgi:uncharacterized membrane protein
MHHDIVSDGANHKSGIRAKLFSAPAAVAGAVLLATFLSFHNLGARSLWLDEAFSVAVARLSWSDFWSIIFQWEANAGLYSLLLKIWSHLDTTEFAVRSLSAVFSIATVPLLYRIGRRLFSPHIGITAAWLLAANPFFIRYAQEARAYALVLFLVTLSSSIFIRCIDTPTGKRFAFYAMVSTLAAYAHFFAFLIPASHLSSLLCTRRTAIKRRDIITGAVLYTLCALPLVYFMVTRDSGQVDWIPGVSLLSLPTLFFAFSGLVDMLAAAVYLLIVPLGLHKLHASYRAAPGRHEQWPYVFVAAWLILPIALILVVSFVKPLFVTRYFIVCLPPFILTAAYGLTSIVPRRACLACTTFVVLVSINAVFTSYQIPQRADWRTSTSFVLASAHPSDAVMLFFEHNWIPFQYYCERLSSASVPFDIVYPQSTGKDIFILTRPQRIDETLIRTIRQTKQRVWIILGNEYPSKEYGYISLPGYHQIPILLRSHQPKERFGERFLREIVPLYPFKSEWNFHHVRIILCHT